MKNNLSILVIAMLIPLGFCLQGCAMMGAKKDPTCFYLLRPEPEGCSYFKQTSGIEESWVLGVTRVRLPKYLDTTKFSYVKCPNQIVYAEFNRWSEPLDAGIQRVLGQDIANRVPCTVMASQPWPSGSKPDYEVYLVFNDLLVDRYNHLFVVDANWMITGPDHGKAYAQGHVCYNECMSQSYEPRCVVNLYNDAIARVSAAVVDGLRDVVKKSAVEAFEKEHEKEAGKKKAESK
jgi:uncharacterized lipoprotein YmbA